MKRYLFLLAIFAFFVYYMSHNIALLKNTFTLSLQSALGYQIAAFLAVTVGFYFMGKGLRLVFDIFDKKRRSRDMMILVLQSLAFNVIFPAGGFSVIALYSKDARKRGEELPAAVAAFIVYTLVGYVALSIVVFLAMIYLKIVNNLTPLVTVPAAVLAIATIALGLSVYLSYRARPFLKKILVWINKAFYLVVNLFRKRKSDRAKGIDSFVDELSLAARDLRRSPRPFFQSVGYIFLYHLCGLIAMYILFISFGYHPLYRVLFAGYVVGILLTMISPSPNGVGFAEAGMVVTFNSLGVNPSLSSAVTILYRGLSFWLPLFIGFVLLQRDGLLSDRGKG